jgi:hypothetical protein
MIQKEIFCTPRQLCHFKLLSLADILMYVLAVGKMVKCTRSFDKLTICFQLRTLKQIICVI